MLSNLSKGLTAVLSKFSLKQKLNEENIELALREIRMALIDADVSLFVIKNFLAEVREKALGKEVFKGLTPSNVFFKTFRDELALLLGWNGESSEKPYSFQLPLNEATSSTVIMLCGLQGSGKTTTIGKLALYLKEKRDPLLVSLDIHRPAAAEQLQRLAQQAGVAYFEQEGERRLKKIIKNAKKYAKKHSHNLILFDTAGRTQLDTDMLDELQTIGDFAKPDANILVCDSMLGQEALRTAETFHKTYPVNSLIFTKFDSDTRGGVLLSVKHVLSLPVAFIGSGEKLEDLEAFSPIRYADRLLGMGDVISLVEKVEQSFDKKKTEKLAKKIAKNEFDLQDFLTQIEQISKMGPLKSVLSLLPGMGEKLDAANLDDRPMLVMKSLIQSMTEKEREKPFLLNNNRRKKRIARGSGRNIPDINKLLKQFSLIKSMMKKAKDPKKAQKMFSSMGIDKNAFPL